MTCIDCAFTDQAKSASSYSFGMVCELCYRDIINEVKVSQKE